MRRSSSGCFVSSTLGESKACACGFLRSGTGRELAGRRASGRLPPRLEGDKLLEPGQEYLFVTNHDQGRGWHQIAAANVADIKIESATQREALVEKVEKAKREQNDPRTL